MFGDKRLEMPKTCGDCYVIHRIFSMGYSPVGNAGKFMFPNACRLVELNNEVYEKLQPVKATLLQTCETCNHKKCNTLTATASKGYCETCVDHSNYSFSMVICL